VIEKPPYRKPTWRQRDILSVIARLYDDSGWPPTLREIGDAVGIASKHGVYAHVVSLEKRGLVERRPMQPGVKVTPEGRRWVRPEGATASPPRPARRTAKASDDAPLNGSVDAREE
jgi:SOS-response transcriptional repressor LexA